MSAPNNVVRRCESSHSLEFISHNFLLRGLVTKLSFFFILSSSLKFLPWGLRTSLFLLPIEICWFLLSLFLLIVLIIFILFLFLFFRLILSIRWAILIVEIIVRILTGICSMWIIRVTWTCFSCFWLGAVGFFRLTTRLCRIVITMIIFIIVNFKFLIRKDFIGLLNLCKLLLSIRIHIRMKCFY